MYIAAFAWIVNLQWPDAYTVLQAGIITDPKASQATIKPSNFQKAAAKACKKNVDDVQSTYGLSASDAPYFCMDLVYEYLLLVEGFGKY